MPRKIKEPPMTLSQETKRITRVEYSDEGLEELIREAVLKRCNITPDDNTTVRVNISGDGDEYPHGASVVIEEVVD
jgi:hypothetical protein